MFGGNAGNIISTASNSTDAANYVTRVEAEKYITRIDAANLRAELVAMLNAHYLAEQRVFENIRLRISECEFKLIP